jgi:FkbM family methyltransferase
VSAEPAAFTYAGTELDALAAAPNYYAWLTERFAPFLGPRIVEVGAGIGTYTAFLLDARPDAAVTAIEPAANCFPRLARRFAAEPRVRAVCGYLDASLPAGAADALVAVNVMEHVRDDAGFLAAARRALAPGGHLCLYVPAVPAIFGALDDAMEHHRRYTRAGLRALLAGAGLDVLRLEYTNLPGVAAWWLTGTVLRRRTLSAASAGAYDRWVIPWVRALERRWTPPLGQSLLAVARSPFPSPSPTLGPG